MTSYTSLPVLAGALLLAVVLPAPAAHAATPNRVAVAPRPALPALTDVTVTTGAAADRIRVSRDEAAYVVEVSTGVTAGAGCAAVSPTAVRCPVAGISAVAVDAGAGNDAISVDAGVPDSAPRVGRTLLRGGPGNDSIFAGEGTDELRGGPGDDWLWGNSGSDRFVADSTDDGADWIEGGDGHDLVDYRERTAAVSVTLDFERNDGTTGENDLVGWDVESALGGRGADRLVGDDNANGLHGGPGGDTVIGGDGADRLHGDHGADVIDGGPGDDWIDDGTGADDARGGPGDDEFEPSQNGVQADLYDGGEGSDTISYGGLRTPYAGVTVDLDGAADDGVPGENDNVLGFETLTGTYLDDRLTGGPGEETLIGGDGADVLDTVDGAPGDWADGGFGGAHGEPDVCRVDAGDTAVACEG
jgi:Ca2+-binding RTX toxin-like protein